MPDGVASVMAAASLSESNGKLMIGAPPAPLPDATAVPNDGPALPFSVVPVVEQALLTPEFCAKPDRVVPTPEQAMAHAFSVVGAAAAAVESAANAVCVAASLIDANGYDGRIDTMREGVDPALAAARCLIPPGHGADPRRQFRRVAIIHYWLVTMRGGERVLERLLALFPEADIFTHVYDPSAVSDTIRARTVKTSFIQKLPGARRHYQSYLPLMPMALEHLDLRGYDLVISSESGPAKGVITAPDALHMCYVHSPMRYLWDHYHDYRDATGLINRMVMPVLCHGLRKWDTSSAARVDRFLANSRFIRGRISKAWRRPAEVVHPPVDGTLFAPSDDVSREYLWVGQLVPYKRADLAIDAFNRLGLPLTVVGDGPMAAQLRKRAGPTIKMIPRMSFDQLRAAYAQCRALVFTAEEDFGIVPVEVMASGRPVVALGRGGALDSVVPGRTGVFFAEQTVDAVVEAVEAMERWLPAFDPQESLDRARDFAPEVFDRGIIAGLV